MQVQGKIKVIGELQTFPSGFTKRELVVKTDEQYPQFIPIEFLKDKADLLNNFAIGQSVVVSINLGGREWVNPHNETKYFVSVSGWRIELVSEAEAPTPVPAPSNEPDDLPF